jgi:hypothetical protein
LPDDFGAAFLAMRERLRGRGAKATRVRFPPEAVRRPDLGAASERSGA